MTWKCAYVALVLIGCSQGTQFNRDESREEEQTQFNLASTLTGGISSSRHHQRANLNSQLYPERVQPGPNSYGTADIDEPHGHENAGVGLLDVRSGRQPTASKASPPNNSLVYPGAGTLPLPVGYPAPAGAASPVGYPVPIGSAAPPTGLSPSAGVIPPVGYPASVGAVPPAAYPVYPGIPGEVGAAHSGAYPVYHPGQPGFYYPGVYLPQYPAYTQPGQFPAQLSGIGPTAPGVTVHAAAPSSYQNERRYPQHNASDRDHWDHTFSMNTEYKEDGVHKGPFGVLNNHNAFGYGSGYGGGYNGAFNSPGRV